MKICFVSGPSKPRQCGITDYVDLLSKELKLQRIDVVKHSFQDLIDRSHSLGKLPEADFYSIQFAPYAFSKNGILRRDINEITQLLKFKKVHLNFHEIWIGAYKRANIKSKLVGWLQKRQIIKFVNQIQPLFITSTNSAALTRLRKEGLNVNYSYLFGNIPYSEIDFKTKNNIINVALFGTPYKDFPYGILIEKLLILSSRLCKPITIRFIGRQREESSIKTLKSKAAVSGIKTFETGPLSTELVSRELQTCDLGISTTPLDAIGKSGSTAAMLEHRLPVLAYDDGDTPTKDLIFMEGFNDQIFILNNLNNLDEMTDYMERSRRPSFDGVAYTAKEIINMLT